jgi:hypothetical protein
VRCAPCSGVTIWLIFSYDRIIMGGWAPKRTSTDDCLVLDAFLLARSGLLRRGVRSGKWQWVGSTGDAESAVQYRVDTTNPASVSVRLSYSIFLTGEWIDYSIALRFTVPPYGGLKWWFTCPLVVNSRVCGGVCENSSSRPMADITAAGIVTP